MDKTRIIVVEDNIVYCEFVCNLLMYEGFRTVQAFLLSTAKKLLQQAKEDDIISFRLASSRRRRHRPFALDAKGRHDATVHHHD